MNDEQIKRLNDERFKRMRDKATHLVQRDYQTVELLTSAEMALNGVQTDASNVTTETVTHVLGQQQAAIISALGLVNESMRLTQLNLDLANSLHDDLARMREASHE